LYILADHITFYIAVIRLLCPNIAEKNQQKKDSQREKESEKVHVSTNRAATRLDKQLSVQTQGARPLKAALLCSAGVDGGAMLDDAGILEVGTVLNVGSVLDVRATFEAPFSLLEADEDGAIPAVLSLESSFFTRVEVRLVVMLTPDPNPNPNVDVPSPCPTLRPLCK
jgi:hypothetical protein